MAVSSLTHAQIRRRLNIWPALFLLILWGCLYLPHLRTSPSWYGDETATLLLGRNLLHGQPALGPLWFTYWQTFAPYQPIYDLVVGVFSQCTGGDILGGRFFNTLLALAVAGCIYFLGRARMGVLPAWFAAALFLTYSQSVIHFRWIYPHNAVALGFTLMVLFLWRPSRPTNDWMSGLGIAIAACAHPLFAHGAIVAFLSRIKCPRAWLRLAIPPALVLGVTLTAIYLYFWGKPWLWSDLASLGASYRDSDAQNGAGWRAIQNFYIFFHQDVFHIGAFIGLILCCRKRFYVLTLCTLSISFLILKNRDNLTLFYYQAIVFTPLLAIAWGSGVATLATQIRRYARGRRLSLLLKALVFVIPIAYALEEIPSVVKAALTPRSGYWATQDTQEVDEAARWINEHTTSEDLVIANSNLAWLLRAKTADLSQVTLWSGYSTVYYPDGMPRDRFRYSADLHKASFVVLGDIDQRWTLVQPNVLPVFAPMETEKWPIVWQGPNYVVLRNPDISSGIAR